jgi:hypothetical protein
MFFAAGSDPDSTRRHPDFVRLLRLRGNSWPRPSKRMSYDDRLARGIRASRAQAKVVVPSDNLGPIGLSDYLTVP